jgi:hypothetical protein
LNAYVYLQSEKACADTNYHELFTVGFYDPKGEWQPESDHPSREGAAKRVAYLNGDTADLERRVAALEKHEKELQDALGMRL